MSEEIEDAGNLSSAEGQGRPRVGRHRIVSHHKTRHLAAATALAFVGSTLAGSIVGLPSALAASGLEVVHADRGAASLDSSDVSLLATPVVAGQANLTVASSVSDVAPVQLIQLAPAAPITAAGAVLAAGAPVAAGGADTSATAASLGIPAPLLDAYKKAAAKQNQLTPGCQIGWSLLAAIGQIESGHAEGGKVDANGTTRGVIQGPATAYGTAKGPMQFLDSTWRTAGADGNGDGVKDVNNVYDATLAAAGYLCHAGGGSLKDPQHLHDAIFSYNHAEWYVQKVIAIANQYSGGGYAVPAAPGSVSTAPVQAPPAGSSTPAPPQPKPTTPTPPTPAPTKTPPTTTPTTPAIPTTQLPKYPTTPAPTTPSPTQTSGPSLTTPSSVASTGPSPTAAG